MAMLKLCRCGQPIPLGNKSCDKCNNSTYKINSSYDKHKRDKQSTSFYNSKPWRRLSNEVYMEQHGLCQLCLKNNKLVTGTYDSKGKFKRNIVDHKIPITVDWSKRFDRENLWILCQSHHNKKTSEDKKKYG